MLDYKKWFNYYFEQEHFKFFYHEKYKHSNRMKGRSIEQLNVAILFDKKLPKKDFERFIYDFMEKAVLDSELGTRLLALFYLTTWKEKNAKIEVLSVLNYNDDYIVNLRIIMTY